MKVLFGTNVIICAVLVSHPMYSRCLPWLRRVQAGEIEGFLSLHSLAEIYSVLTKLPLSQRVTPMDAQQIISRDLKGLVSVGLAFEDYQAAIDLAFILVNLWIYLLWCFVSRPRPGGRVIYQQLFPLKTMLEFLDHAVERLFPPVTAIFLP